MGGFIHPFLKQWKKFCRFLQIFQGESDGPADGNMAERGGFEFLSKPNKNKGKAPPCHLFLHSRPDLSKVVQSWDSLPDAIKSAIISLVASTHGGAK